MIRHSSSGSASHEYELSGSVSSLFIETSPSSSFFFAGFFKLKLDDEDELDTMVDEELCESDGVDGVVGELQNGTLNVLEGAGADC